MSGKKRKGNAEKTESNPEVEESQTGSVLKESDGTNCLKPSGKKRKHEQRVVNAEKTEPIVDKSEIDIISSDVMVKRKKQDSDLLYYRDYVIMKKSQGQVLEESVLDEMDLKTKVAAAAALPSVVGILCRDLPDDMAVRKSRLSKFSCLSKSEIESRGGDLVFWGCGIIIECEQQQDSEDLPSYLSTIICPATLFVRTDGVQPPDIKVHVYLWDGKLCEGQVLAWDFHFNLAAVRVQSDSLLPTATLRGLDDLVSILPTNRTRSFQLLSHSDLFKISPGTKIITLARTLRPRNAHVVGSGVFGTTSCSGKVDCNELYWVHDDNHPAWNGGAVINYSGEVIGLMFYNSSFLPINIISSWWNHFKSCRQYRRPWLGVEITNLHSCCLNFLAEFMRKFPNVGEGVVVTKVADSPAYCSGIRPKDVIVKCDGIVVRSTLEFFDIVWNKVGGESVELNILRASDAETLKISLALEETAPDKFYQWKRAIWNVLPRNE